MLFRAVITMYIFFQKLTKEQRLAILGLAVEFAGSENFPSEMQFYQVSQYLNEFADSLEISQTEASQFMKLMEENGRASYAINILKDINEKTLGIVYPDYYRILNILHSHKGLNRLNNIYRTDFKFTDDGIEEIVGMYDLGEIDEELRPNLF